MKLYYLFFCTLFIAQVSNACFREMIPIEPRKPPIIGYKEEQQQETTTALLKELMSLNGLLNNYREEIHLKNTHSLNLNISTLLEECSGLRSTIKDFAQNVKATMDQIPMTEDSRKYLQECLERIEKHK